MGTAKFKNFWSFELLEGINSGSGTIRVLTEATEALGTLTGGDYYMLTLWDGQQDPEIVKATANPLTGYLTVTRAQEGTAAKAWAAGTQVICALTEEVINLALAAYVDMDVLLAQNYLKLSGGTLTGALVLPGAPTLDLHAASKSYVDSVLGGLLSRSGGAMTGTLNMQSNRIIQLPAPLSAAEPARLTEVTNLSLAFDKIISDQEGSLVTAGTASAYTVTTQETITTLTDGYTLTARMHASSAAGATLNLNGIGAKPIQVASGVAVGLGILLADVPYSFTYSAALNAWVVHSSFDPGLCVPTGCVVSHAGSVAPSGWALCYGQSYLRTAQPRLFAVIGTTYGAVDGNSFNVPDCRDRADIGLGNMGGVAAGRLDSNITLGGTQGSKSHQIAKANLPALDVDIAAGQGNHNHTGTTDALKSSGSGGGAWTAGNQIQTGTITINNNTLPAMVGTVRDVGTNTAISNVQPSIAFNKIIKL